MKQDSKKRGFGERRNSSVGRWVNQSVYLRCTSCIRSQACRLGLFRCRFYDLLAVEATHHLKKCICRRMLYHWGLE